MNEGTITGAIPKTRCQRCGQPTYLYGIHTCSPQAPEQKDVNDDLSRRSVGRLPSPNPRPEAV